MTQQLVRPQQQLNDSIRRWLAEYLDYEIEIHGIHISATCEADRGRIETVIRTAVGNHKHHHLPADGGGVILAGLRAFKNLQHHIDMICKASRLVIDLRGEALGAYGFRRIASHGGVYPVKILRAYHEARGGDATPVAVRSAAKALARQHLVNRGSPVKPLLKLFTNDILADFVGRCSNGAASPRRCAALHEGPCKACAFLLESRKIDFEPAQAPQLDLFVPLSPASAP